MAEGAIASRTRTHLELTNTDILDLERTVRIGDWEEGGREYQTYVNFLGKPQEGEDLEDEDDETTDEEDEEYTNRLRGFDASVFDRPTRQTRSIHQTFLHDPPSAAHSADGGLHDTEEPKEKRQRAGSAIIPVEGPAVAAVTEPKLPQRQRPRPRALRPALQRVTTQAFPPAPFSAEEASQVAQSILGRGVGDFSDQQLRTLQSQIQAHTQMLLQTLVASPRGNSNNNDESNNKSDPANRRCAYLQCQAHEMLMDLSICHQSLLTEAGDQSDPDPSSEGRSGSVLSNPLVRQLPKIVLHEDAPGARRSFALVGSPAPLLEDLGPLLRPEFALNGEPGDGKSFEALNMKRSQLFTPAEDSLLARAIGHYGLQYETLTQFYVTAKTPSQLKWHVTNLLQRKKGNEVERAVWHLRTHPLDEVEVDWIREGLGKHGLRWKVIRTECMGLWKREAHFLGPLWEKHVETNEDDRRLTNRLKRLKGEAEGTSSGITTQPLPEGSHGDDGAADDSEDDVDETTGSSRDSRSDYTEQASAEDAGYDDEDDALLGGDCGEEGEEAAATATAMAPPRRKWCQAFDRAILLRVRECGAGETAFHSAWRDLGGQDSPFTVEEISQRYAWLSAKFMEMGAQ
mmetsp:Transcript_3392/g.8864  ORF Transcript_3392/g.8864 Transcript_3392/m.8864 type:complete len:627 (+) Transcript_3392:1-1881(+)